MKVEPSHLRTYKFLHIPNTNNLYYTIHNMIYRILQQVILKNALDLLKLW